MELNLNTTAPWEKTSETEEEVKDTVEQPTEELTEEPKVEEPKTGEASTNVEEPPKEETPEVDTFFDNFNKRFSTQYKTDEEIKGLFNLQKKVGEYESRQKELDDIVTSVEEYKKKIQELEGDQDPLKYFSSPESYVAEQLRIKYPKSNPILLQEIATSNVDGMNDLDVLIKEKQLFVHNPPRESAIRAIILKKYGIDAEANPDEWDELAKAEMQIDAATARDKINTLKGAIELPKIVTKEQKEQAEQQAKTQREQAIAPLKDGFSKFEKFTHEAIPGFEMDVHADYKSKLPDMFAGFFRDANVEPTEENMKSLVELRNALYVYEYLPTLREIWIKEGKTEVQKKTDEELNNTLPPNTTTRTEEAEVKNYKGLSDFFTDEGFK